MCQHFKLQLIHARMRSSALKRALSFLSIRECVFLPELLAKFIQFETKHNNPLSDVLIFLHLFFYLCQNF